MLNTHPNEESYPDGFESFALQCTGVTNDLAVQIVCSEFISTPTSLQYFDSTTMRSNQVTPRRRLLHALAHAIYRSQLVAVTICSDRVELTDYLLMKSQIEAIKISWLEESRPIYDPEKTLSYIDFIATPAVQRGATERYAELLLPLYELDVNDIWIDRPSFSVSSKNSPGDVSRSTLAIPRPYRLRPIVVPLSRYRR